MVGTEHRHRRFSVYQHSISTRPSARAPSLTQRAACGWRDCKQPTLSAGSRFAARLKAKSMAEEHKLADAAIPISVILPVLNDEPQLCHTLEQAASVLAASGLTHEIIIVAADLQHAAVPDAAGLSSVSLVSQEHGSGWGDATWPRAHRRNTTSSAPSIHTLSTLWPKSPAC